MDTTSGFLLAQILIQLPILFVSSVGVILAIGFWSKAPRPCLLTLIAMGLLLITTVSILCIQGYAHQAQNERYWDIAQYSQIMSATAITGSIIRAVAVGLLLGAVVSGRSPTRSY